MMEEERDYRMEFSEIQERASRTEFGYMRELAPGLSELGRKPGCKVGSCRSFSVDYVGQCLPLVFTRRPAAHVWAALRMVTRLPRLW